MKPFIGRIGGKFFLRKTIIKYIPNNYTTYIEPFVGAGSIFFYLKHNDNIKEVINDLDEDLIRVYNALKLEGDIINLKFNRDINVDYFNSIKNKNDELSLLEKYKHSYFSTGKCYSKSKNSLNQERKSKTDFSIYKPRLQNTIILNKDFKEVVIEYDSENSFFYLDPPYSKTLNIKNGYYNNNTITPKDVYDVLKNIKGKFLLSYDNTEEVRDIFKDYKIVEVDTRYSPTSSVNSRKVKELLIMNY
jgi:DNA adenine methylase